MSTKQKHLTEQQAAELIQRWVDSDFAREVEQIIRKEIARNWQGSQIEVDRALHYFAQQIRWYASVENAKAQGVSRYDWHHEELHKAGARLDERHDKLVRRITGIVNLREKSTFYRERSSRDHGENRSGYAELVGDLIDAAFRRK